MVSVNKILDLAVDAGEAAVDALGKPIGALAELFSPSLKAAKEITQDKGSYEQLRAMMIKNGAKADELEWSGADEFFQGQKTTKQEIADYLEANDPRLVPEVRQAEGVLGSDGGEAMDMRQAVDQLMEDQVFVNDRRNEEFDLLVNNLNSDDAYFNPISIDKVELERLAKELKTNTDDLSGKDWAHRNEDGDIEFFQYSDEALAHKYGGDNKLTEELNIKVRERLEAEFENDPPQFIYQYELTPEYGGETQYSSFFPEGGSDYTEKLYQYRDPTGRIPIDMVAGSSHFGDSDLGTIFHTRQADYPVEGGGTARYIGEIQSDPQQKIGDRTSKTYEQSLAARDIEILKEKMRGLSEKDTLIKADMFSNINEFDRKRLGYEASIYDLNKKLKSEDQGFIKNLLQDAFPAEMNNADFGEIPLSGEMTEAQEQLVNAWIRTQPFRGKNWVGDVDAQSMVSNYLLSNPVDWLPNNFRNEFSNVSADSMERALDMGEIQNEIIKKRSTTYNDTGGYQYKGGPLMSSQNKWVDQALNQSILDAVNDPDIDYLTFPNDVEAIGQVGGTSNPKEGTVNFYIRDVQNRLKKILGKFDKNVPIEEVNLERGGGDSLPYGTLPFPSKGIKVTPEFREAVRKKGVPTAVVAPFVGYGALDAISEDENTGGAI